MGPRSAAAKAIQRHIIKGRKAFVLAGIEVRQGQAVEAKGGACVKAMYEVRQGAPKAAEVCAGMGTWTWAGSIAAEGLDFVHASDTDEAARRALK